MGAAAAEVALGASATAGSATWLAGESPPVFGAPVAGDFRRRRRRRRRAVWAPSSWASLPPAVSGCVLDCPSPWAFGWVACSVGFSVFGDRPAWAPVSVPDSGLAPPPPRPPRRRDRERPLRRGAAGFLAWSSPPASGGASACDCCGACSVVCLVSAVLGRDEPLPRPLLRRRRGRGPASWDLCSASAGRSGACSVIPRSFPLGEPGAPFRPRGRAARVARCDAGLGLPGQHDLSGAQFPHGAVGRTDVRGRGRLSGRRGTKRGMVRGHCIQHSRAPGGRPYLNRLMWMFSRRPTAMKFVRIEVPP